MKTIALIATILVALAVVGQQPDLQSEPTVVPVVYRYKPPVETYADNTPCDAECASPPVAETTQPPLVEPVAGRCVEWEPHLQTAHPEWDVERMSRIMWRESRCLPHVRSDTSDSGLLQINDINHQWLVSYLGEHVDEHTLRQPEQNIRAAAALCEYWEALQTTDCYQPWQATDRG